ncbi:hypothetical protein [Sphingomonas sp.]|uniref:hypothetical protein n=1 Tax=Sphingomonas sp. TaxID=28214 RepID=UPI0035621DED
MFGHRARPHIQRNQGFAFSTCQRCNRDMIRSADAPPTSEWRDVPSGFRVTRKSRARPCDSHRVSIGPMGTLRVRSTATYLVRIGATALFWHVRDALRAQPARRQKTLRLTLA